MGRNHASPRLAWVNNIPTRYRIHLFDVITEEARQRGWRFESMFMAGVMANRSFHNDLPPSRHPYRVFEPWRYRTAGGYGYLNPALIRELVWQPPELLIVSGWSDVTAMMLLSAMPLLCPRTRVCVWLEANSYSTKHTRGPIHELRRLLLRRADALIVPGRMAEMTIADQWAVHHAQMIRLPNLVDEELYGARAKDLRARRNVIRSRMNISDSDIVLLTNGRLEERHKGLMLFVSHVRHHWPERVILLAAGTGPDEDRTRNWLIQNGLNEKVRLLGQLKAENVVECLAASDAFVLPSVDDPNPLAVIEAAWAGLPLLVSSRCGNAEETVRPGVNGWTFDPYSGDEVRQALRQVTSRDRTELEVVGRRSEEIAKSGFSSRQAVLHFLDQIGVVNRL